VTGPGWLAFAVPAAWAVVAHTAGDGRCPQDPGCVLPEGAGMSTGAQRWLNLAGQIPVRTCPARSG
jgi:hypothetical protein